MTYIHPDCEEIKSFIEEVIGDRKELKQICETIFAWFDNNITYSRLNSPFFPLQRSDLDVLKMKSGTCGDYSNLIVSVLLSMGYEAGYAYVHKDCYGDEQDHICTAVKVNEKWILIDATNPYRKWYRFDCPHREYELLSPDEFEKRMKREEAYWTSVAEMCGKKDVAGLWYAPWIHEEVIVDTEDVLDSMFFLLIMDENVKAVLYGYYQCYTKEKGFMPCMITIVDEKIKYQFAICEPKSFWDNEQWSQSFSLEDIPTKYQTEALKRLCECVENIKPRIQEILRRV